MMAALFAVSFSLSILVVLGFLAVRRENRQKENQVTSTKRQPAAN